LNHEAVPDDERTAHVRDAQLARSRRVVAIAAVVVDIRDRQAADFELDVAVLLEVDRRDRRVIGEVNIEVGRGDVDRARAVGLAVEPGPVTGVIDVIVRGARAQRQQDQPAATHTRAFSKRRAEIRLNDLGGLAAGWLKR